MEKRILDACCGPRMFWFDKEHPDVLYQDIREFEGTVYDKKIKVAPDIRWFHDYIYNKAEIRFIKGRLRFGGARTVRLSPQWS